MARAALAEAEAGLSRAAAEEDFLRHAVAELDKRLVIKSDKRYIAIICLLDQRPGRWPKPHIFADLTHFLNVGRKLCFDLSQVFALCEI